MRFLCFLIAAATFVGSHAFTSQRCHASRSMCSFHSVARAPLPGRQQPRGRSLEMRWGLKGPQANKIMGDTGDVPLRDTVPFELRGFSLPLVVFSIGAALTASSFVGFFMGNEGGGDGSISSLGFVYGIPVFLIGLSLWYAEIPPVVIEADADGEAAFQEMATDTMKKIRQDVTRHRYGDDAHLDSTLETLGLKLPQKKFPRMKTIELKRTPSNELSYTMVFQSLETPYKVWADPERVKRYSKFFGPGIVAEVLKVNSEQRLVGLRLTTTTKPDPATNASVDATPAQSTASTPASAAGGDDF